jgi:hypothetical protein
MSNSMQGAPQRKPQIGALVAGVVAPPPPPPPAATAAVTKAVEAACVVLVPGAAVGTVGVPVSAGDVSVGVVRVGDVANTFAPLPVSSVIAAARLALDGVARNVLMPVAGVIDEPQAEPVDTPIPAGG